MAKLKIVKNTTKSTPVKRVRSKKTLPVEPSFTTGEKVAILFRFAIWLLMLPFKIVGKVIYGLWFIFWQPPYNQSMHLVGFVRLMVFVTLITSMSSQSTWINPTPDPGIIEHWCNAFFTDYLELTFWNNIVANTAYIFIYGMIFLGLILSLIVTFGFHNRVQASAEVAETMSRYENFPFPNIANFLVTRESRMRQASNSERVEMLRNTGFMTAETFVRSNMSGVEKETFETLNSRLGQMTNSEQIKFMTGKK